MEASSYYNVYTKIQLVMNEIVKKMTICNDNKIFRNMAAVYVMWQDDLDQCRKYL